MAGEALSKTASATSLTISFHKKCDKEWRKLRDKLEAQFQEDIGRLYAKSLYWDLEVLVSCKTIRAHHSILQVRAPKFFSHLRAIQEPSSPSSRYSSAALEKASVDYLESFIRDIYLKNSIEEEEKSLLQYLENILINPKQFPGEFGGISKNESILSPESDIYVTPKSSPSEIIEQFGLVDKGSNGPLSKENLDQLVHSPDYTLSLESISKDCKEITTSELSCEEDLIYSSPLSKKRPISDRDAHTSYYSIVPVDDVCREERPRHLDLKGKGYSPAFGNSAGEALEKELAEQDELLKSFQSILSKEGGKPEKGRCAGGRFNSAGRGSYRLGIPVRDHTKSNESCIKNQRPLKEASAKGISNSSCSRSRDGVSRLPVRKQPKLVNLVSSKGSNERCPTASSLNESSVPNPDQDRSLSFVLNQSYRRDVRQSASLNLKSTFSKSGLLQNNQYGTDAEMDGLIDYHEEVDRLIPLKASPYSCEEAEEDEEFLCSACSPCSPDMEGGVSSSQQDSGLDTGTSGSGGNPPPGGGATAGDPTPSDATTSSSWHCLHSVSSPLLPRDPSVPQLLSPSYVSVASEGNGEVLGVLPGAECCSIAIGEDDTEAAVLSKLKSSSVSVSSGAVSDTDDVGMMEYDETEVGCGNVLTKDVINIPEDHSKIKEPISFSDTMTKSIEVYQTVEPGAGSLETTLSTQVNFTKCEYVSHLKLVNGINDLPDEIRNIMPSKESNYIVSSQMVRSKSGETVHVKKNLDSVVMTKSCLPAISTVTSKELNGDLGDGDDIQMKSCLSSGLKIANCDVAEVNLMGDGVATADEVNEHVPHISSKNISGAEASSNIVSEDKSSKAAQHFFIDAATLRDESEFVTSLSSTQQIDIQEASVHDDAEGELKNCIQEKDDDKSVKHFETLDEGSEGGNQATDNEVLPSGEISVNNVSATEHHHVHDGENPIGDQTQLPASTESVSGLVSAAEASVEQELGTMHACTEKVSVPQIASEKTESNNLKQDGVGNVGVSQVELIANSAPIEKKIVEVSSPAEENSFIGALQGGTLMTSHKVSNNEPHTWNGEKVPDGIIVAELCKTTKESSDTISSGDSGTLNSHSHAEPFEVHNYQCNTGTSEEKITFRELNERATIEKRRETAAEVSKGGEIAKRLKKEVQGLASENAKNALPQRAGELIRGDTFELEPGEERVTWFRQEHERRQGSMLFQSLQRQSSVDSINKVQQHNTQSGFIGVEKLGMQSMLHGCREQFCASTLPLTQSLPPSLTHNISMTAIPTPPNTLQRTKCHNQVSAGVPLNSTTMDTIHKLFGEEQRLQGDVDSVSPLQRFSQRFKPSKEEDVQSPDSLNNDGPMETFVRDAVLVNRISTTNTVVSMETGEEEEETGPIVEKQTDEYLEKERRDEINHCKTLCSTVKDDDGQCSVVSMIAKAEDITVNAVSVESLKRQKRTESTPIVSGGASAADFVQMSPARPSDSPLTRRRSEAAPILSGGGPPPEEPKKETLPSGSPRCPRRWDGTPPTLSAWVVDMSDCIKGDSSSTGPPSLALSWSPSTPEARKRHRRRRSEGMPFSIGNRGLRAVEFSEQPADEVSPLSSSNVSFSETKLPGIEGKNTESQEAVTAEGPVVEKKKPLFSMFIDIGDSCKSGGSKGKEMKKPKELPSGMSSSWQPGSSHNRGTTECLESVNKTVASNNSEVEAPKSSDSCRSGSVFMYIDASQPAKSKPEAEKEAKSIEVTKEETLSQLAGGQTQRAEQKGFFMFIEADPTPPVMRKPFLLKDGHLTSTPPSKRHSWNQDAPTIIEGISSGPTPPIRRHKRTQSLSVVGRSSSGSNVPHLLESASGEDSDHASQSASISSMSAGQVSTSVAGSSLSLVEGGLDSGSSTGEFKPRTSGIKERGGPIGSSPEGMPHEGSSRCQIVEEDCEERSGDRPQTKVEVTHDACIGTCKEEDESYSEPLVTDQGGGSSLATQNSHSRSEQGKSVPENEGETSAGMKKTPKIISHKPDTKEAIEEEAKKQFVKLSDLDKSTSTADADAMMAESSESFGAEDVMSSSSGSRRVRPVEEISWIESKARQGSAVCGGGSNRGRLLYPIGLNKGASRGRRGRSESPGKNGSNSGGSPAPLHRDGAEEQPLSESASALSSMQSSVDRSALEGSTEETDMSSSLGGSRSAPCSRLGQDLLRMFLDEVNTDVTVEVEGHSVRAHKCILSSRCQYFAAMLSGGWVESAGNVISLQGFSYSAVHFALCHIYSGTSNIPETISIVELATLADMLGLEGLKEVIMYTLKVKYCHFFHKPCAVCAVGVLECLPLAAAYGLDEIYRKSLKWITKYFIRIWPSKAFAALPRELIEKCYHQHVVHMSVENILDTVMCCDKLLATLPNVRWAEPVFGITSQLLEASVKFIADNFSGVVLSDKFQSLGKELSWNISRLEESVAGAADMLSLEQACLSHVNIARLLSTATSPEQETHEAQWSTNFVDFLKRLEVRVEGRLVRGAGRVTRCRSWTQLDPQVRRRIQEKACVVGLDLSSGGGSSSSGRRRRVGLEDEDGGSSSGCGGSDETGSGTTGRRGRHSSLLRTSEQRPNSARANASGNSIYCTIPRSASVRSKGKDGTEGRGKLANGMVATGASVSSQSQAAVAAAALLDSKHKSARKEKGAQPSAGITGTRSKSGVGRLHQKGQAAEESRVTSKKESSVTSSTVVVRARKKVSQLDKEKSASTMVAKSDAKAVSQSAENVASRPKTWPMRVMEGKSSRSSPQLQPPTSSTGVVSSNTATPEKTGSVSSRVRISSSDSSRNSSPALRPKGSVRGAATKSNRTFTPTPTRGTKKPDAPQQQTGSPLGGSQGTLTKGGVSSPRRGVTGNTIKAAPSRPTPDSASSRASNSPLANLRRTSNNTSIAATAGRNTQVTAAVTPTPKRAVWSRNKSTGPTQLKQNSGAAVPSPPRATSVRSGPNEAPAKKIAPGSKPRTPLAERSTRPFSPKATATVNGGGISASPGGHSSSAAGSRKKPFSGTYTHSRTGSNVSLDKGKVDIVTPSGVGERSGTFLKDEPTVLKRPENMGAGK